MNWKMIPNQLNDEITEVMGLPIANFEYCFDAHKQQYLSVGLDAHLKQKLQDKYPRVTVYSEDYYPAWLSLLPGQEAKLQLHIEALNANPCNGDYLTFDAHTNYQVTVNGQVNEAIRITPSAGSSEKAPQVVDITVKCIKACSDTSLCVLDKNGNLAGQLNVVSNTKIHQLPIRVVYLVKDGAASSTNLSALQSTFAGLNLSQYLNENSLNQANIQTFFERTSQTYQLVFKETEWAGKYYDVANMWYTDYVGIPKTLFLEKVMADYRAKYEASGTVPFRGIVLVVTDIRKNPADHEGGVSQVRPVNARGIIIYETNLKKESSYAHEIGHTLGLDHTFLGVEDKADLSARKANILGNKSVLALDIKARIAYTARIKYFQAQIANSPSGSAEQKVAQDALEAERKAVAQNEKTIMQAQAQIASNKQEIQAYAANPFKFGSGVTQNFMDYVATRAYFFHWQWKIMQNDVIRYYGS
ncbi:hypothetical protein GCM10022409_23330 [Hymenobacter glaciei]|uniref:Peptidase M12B domain-containing protein n=2 Tax=Hymenobacter glaciei TaxID=877209 RepID=A0ABP7U7V7_9BACT